MGLSGAAILQCVLGPTCVALFVFAARLERDRPVLWGALAAALWLLAWLALGGGVLLVLVAEALLYGGMAAWLARRAGAEGGGRVRK